MNVQLRMTVMKRRHVRTLKAVMSANVRQGLLETGNNVKTKMNAEQRLTSVTNMPPAIVKNIYFINICSQHYKQF